MALRNTKSSDKNRIRLTSAAENALNTKPNTSKPSVPPPSSLCAARISRHTASAPANAASGTPMPPMPKASTPITPKAAPPEVPIRLGSASGFSNSACKAAPAAASAAPTNSAAHTRGKRMARTVSSAWCGICHSPKPMPVQNQMKAAVAVKASIKGTGFINKHPSGFQTASPPYLAKSCSFLTTCGVSKP